MNMDGTPKFSLFYKTEVSVTCKPSHEEFLFVKFLEYKKWKSLRQNFKEKNGTIENLHNFLVVLVFYYSL